MKPEIHPDYQSIKATCSCGNVIEVGSTLSEDIHLDVCSNCHPFYTGKQKIVDSGGRVERFRKRFGNRTSAGAQAEAQSEAETEAPTEAPTEGE
jgi:large subunit ribosomal protein L31